MTEYIPGRCSRSFPITVKEYCDPNVIRQDSKVVDYWWDGYNFHIVLENGQEFSLIDAQIAEHACDNDKEITSVEVVEYDQRIL
jgi:hypothetical protein